MRVNKRRDDPTTFGTSETCDEAQIALPCIVSRQVLELRRFVGEHGEHREHQRIKEWVITSGNTDRNRCGRDVRIYIRGGIVLLRRAVLCILVCILDAEDTAYCGILWREGRSCNHLFPNTVDEGRQEMLVTFGTVCPPA